MATRTLGTADLPRLTRAATIVPNTLDEEKRTVDVVWTTGAPVLRGYFDQYWEELSLDPGDVRLKRLNNGAPFLNAHNDYSADDVVGVVESGSASVDGKRGIATIRFAKAEDDPEADKIYRKVKDGILQNVSVGYQTYTMEKVEGGSGKIPTYRATDWEPYEISVVPAGADDGAGFRSANNERTKCVFITRQQETTMSGQSTDPTTQSGESAAVAATRAAAQQRAEQAKALALAAEEASQAAVAAERTRSVEIRKLARQAKLGEQWAQSLIEAGTTVADARAAAFEHLVHADNECPTGGGVRIGAGDDERDKWIRGAAAWLIERTGKRKQLEQAKAKDPELFGGLEFGGGASFRGLSPLELARDSLERQHVRTRGMDKMRMLGMAFTYRNAPMQTSSDFAVIMEQALHKLLLGAYVTQDTVWPRFCGTDDVPDFRQSNRYRTGSLPSLPRIAEHGEYTTGTIPDGAKYTISTERHGEIFSLSREVIINDDMGALANLAMEFGRAAARTIENDVFALLLANNGLGPTMPDGKPFFDAAHGNIGPGAALSASGLDGDRVLMRAQKDPSGRDFLSLAPSTLLVPDGIYFRAKQINSSVNDPDATNKAPLPNPVQGLFSDVIGTPRLTGTRRYMFSDPTIAAALVVAFLEGYGRGPIMESQNGWRIDGVEWKVTQYARAQAADTRAAVTNPGA